MNGVTDAVERSADWGEPLDGTVEGRVVDRPPQAASDTAVTSTEASTRDDRRK
jgi:hypothetical protein